ncbi:MAG: hypothetical protein ATN36_08190 [Epulopiscium sp. Nele67-Bin005]|nr:MAG: hypothetical protein ATN36_08190 [Epulopiscium sp. Nele67-Bin005]
MVILFLYLNVALILVQLLTTYMMRNYFTKIHTSVLILNDNKVYKSELETEFLRNLLEDYNGIQRSNDGQADVDLFVRRRITRDYIGIFKFSLIEYISVYLKFVILGIWILQMGIYLLELNNIFYVGLNIVICLFSISLGFVGRIKFTKEELILIVKDFLINQHQFERQQNEENKEIQRLTNELNSVILLLEMQEQVNMEESAISKEETATLSENISLKLQQIQDDDTLKNVYKPKSRPKVNISDTDIFEIIEDMGI